MARKINLANYSIVERSLNHRSYTYQAFVNKKTRRVYKIKAGCRTWWSFAHAFNHYTIMHPTQRDKYNWVVRKTGIIGSPNPERLEMQRQESVALLKRLEKDVNFRIRYLRNRARKQRRR